MVLKHKRSIQILAIIFISFASVFIDAQELLKVDITRGVYSDGDRSSYKEILEYPLTVVTFEGFITPHALRNSLIYMAKSYLACGIRFKILHIHKYRPSLALPFDPYSSAAPSMMENWLGDLPADIAKPVLMYVPLYSRMGTLSGVAMTEQKSAVVPAHLLNIAWINTSEVPSNRFSAIVNRVAGFKSINFTTEAHELGHIFLRGGHVAGDLLSANIMADGGAFFVSSQFTSEQCEYMRAHPINH